MISVTSTERSGAVVPNVLVIGAMGTKAAELAALADEIEALGGAAILLDTSARYAERPADQVCAGAGSSTRRRLPEPPTPRGWNPRTSVRPSCTWCPTTAGS